MNVIVPAACACVKRMSVVEYPLMNDTNKNFFVETIKFVAIALLIVFPVRFFIAQPFIVSGASMDPTFHDGQYLIVDELSYRFGAPGRGDVIVFVPPVDESKYYIKRIIGLPGETLTIKGTQITVKNAEHPEGFVLPQPYIASGEERNDDITVTLTSNQYYVMGDNRFASSDSRIWGPITRDAIVGRPIARLFPVTSVSVLPGTFNYTN